MANKMKKRYPAPYKGLNQFPTEQLVNLKAKMKDPDFEICYTGSYTEGNAV
jgi:hypothetical protein